MGGGNTDPAGSGTLIADVWATGAQEAWAVLQNAQTRRSQLLHTTTGPAGFASVAIPATSFVRYVRFFNSTEGLLVRWDPNMSVKQIFRTTDGGATWLAPQDLPAPTTDLLRGCVTLGTHIWLNTASGLVLHSPDRGATWAAAATGLGPGLRTISFRDAAHGLALGSGGAGSVFRTSDGGATWAPLAATGPVHFTSVSAVPGLPSAYLSAGSGTQGDTGGSSLSTDDGATWQPLETSLDLGQVTATASGQAWAASYYAGTLYRYTTGPALGTQAPRNGQALAMYPNPSGGILHMPASAQRQQVLVYDATGRVVLQQTLPAGTTQLDLTALEAGLYELLSIASSGAVGRGGCTLCANIPQP